MPRGIFDRTFEVWRATSAPDGAGGHLKTFALNATTIGRLTPLAASQTPRALQELGVAALRFSCPSATDILVDDQVRIGSRIARVHAVTRTSTDLRKQCVCEEVNAS